MSKKKYDNERKLKNQLVSMPDEEFVQASKKAIKLSMKIHYADIDTFKNSMTAHMREAIWSYMTDHMSLAQDGSRKAYMIFRDEDDFWRRVYARYSGKFSKRDSQKMTIEATIRAKKVGEILSTNAQKQLKLSTIRVSKNVYLRTLLKIHGLLEKRLLR